MSKVFNKYAAIYDAFYSEKNYKSETDYVVSIIGDTGIKSALDLGCGTGQFTVEFMKLGMQVHGVDFSEDMIKIAKANAETSYLTPNTLPTFSVADIRNYVSGEKYELVFSLFHVINYMTTNTDLNKFFKTAHQSLLSGGLLVFDYWYGPAVLANPPTKRTREISWNGTRVVRYATPTLSSKENRVDVRYEFEIDQRDGTVLDSYEETHKMRFLFDDEIKAFSSGLFEQIVSFGWMTTTEPSELNWSAVTVLRKI